MSVETLGYFVFLALVASLARLTRTARQRTVLLLGASYVFYAGWGLGFLLFLMSSSLLNFALGEWLRRKPSAPRLWMGVCANLLPLGFFKYLPSSAHIALGGWLPLGLARIAVPIGISFWTFQALSYLFDLYREEELHPSLLEFCLYLSFWPTVISGPVCRLGEMLPQFRTVSWPGVREIGTGVRRILLGLFLKVFLAQVLAAGLRPGEGLDAGFDGAARPGGLDVWFLVLGYGMQLYFDFSGYSHIVIGSARLVGLRLPENFDQPYLSPSPSVFWTRWHMSLSSWIRDYVFFPLAASRRERGWRYVALMVAMVTFGIWHGATWLFLVWGLYHGLLLVLDRLIQDLRQRSERSLGLPLRLLGWGLTTAAVMLGWVFFRAHDLRQALGMLAAVMSPGTYRQLSLAPNFYLVTTIIAVSTIALEAIVRFGPDRARHPALARAVWLASPAWYAVMVLVVILWSGLGAPFVYFQF